MQVVAYMQRKGVGGAINTPRMASFFRSTGAGTIIEFQSQCTLHSGTLAAGDVLYQPTGSVVGEMCHTTNVGFRFPVVVHGVPNIIPTFNRRRDELLLAGDAGKAELKMVTSLLETLRAQAATHHDGRDAENLAMGAPQTTPPPPQSSEARRCRSPIRRPHLRTSGRSQFLNPKVVMGGGHFSWPQVGICGPLLHRVSEG